MGRVIRGKGQMKRNARCGCGVAGRRTWILLMAVWAAAARVAADDPFAETQGFMDIEVQGRLARRWSLLVNYQSKVRDDDPEHFLWHVKGVVRYKASKWLCLGLAHRHEEDRSNGDWKREWRSEFEMIPEAALGGWKLTSRNRFEYRDFESPKEDLWRYRNEFKAAHTLITPGLAGYVSEEPMYDFETQQWSKHRLTTGLDRRISRRVRLSVYYCWDIIKKTGRHEKWDTTQIFGVKLIFDLDGMKTK